jgi:hypothetical protein
VTVVVALSGVWYAVSCSSHRGCPYCVPCCVGVLGILLDVFCAWGPWDPPRYLLQSTKDNDVGGLLKANNDDVFLDH